MDTKSLTETASVGDRYATLEALRGRLALSIDQAAYDGNHGAVASLAKQLSDVLRELDAMPVKENSAVDELASARASRRAKAASS